MSAASADKTKKTVSSPKQSRSIPWREAAQDNIKKYT
jgi:hypothetical protein